MELIEIYSGTWIQCQMAKKLLESVKIKATLKDPNMGIDSSSTFCRPRGNIKLLVLDSDYESATNIVTKL
ncbi:putative signal transducing protein [Runella limosa]|uniref:putative signal transducing protein n=1 Tax=Runella limosa TaxID=370978 RepID=UPI000491A8C8|nr:DUF2007 domain-containing protein [Runella limosa]MCA0232086.1 DUF2007 domain-containing protein [Bacteroidota bacterium]